MLVARPHNKEAASSATRERQAQHPQPTKNRFGCRSALMQRQCAGVTCGAVNRAGIQRLRTAVQMRRRPTPSRIHTQRRDIRQPDALRPGSLSNGGLATPASPGHHQRRRSRRGNCRDEPVESFVSRDRADGQSAQSRRPQRNAKPPYCAPGRSGRAGTIRPAKFTTRQTLTRACWKASLVSKWTNKTRCPFACNGFYNGGRVSAQIARQWIAALSAYPMRTRIGAPPAHRPAATEPRRRRPHTFSRTKAAPAR